MEGDIRDSYSSNEICVAHIASCSLFSATFGQYSGFLIHLGNKGDLSHLHNMDISLLYYSLYIFIVFQSIYRVIAENITPIP